MTAAEIDTALSDVLAAALSLGLPAFSCRPDKRPACPHGYRDATADPTGLRALWCRHPGQLVGVPTGQASGLDVLDIDAPRHPEAAVWLLGRRDRLPASRIHRTRSGDRHLLSVISRACAAGPGARLLMSTAAATAVTLSGGPPLGCRSCAMRRQPRGRSGY
jgi:hypothetical protein